MGRGTFRTARLAGWRAWMARLLSTAVLLGATPVQTLRAITSLAAMGHETAELPALSPIFGCAGAIRIDATGCSGAHDPRGEGLAL